MRIYLISDNQDTFTGLRLVGVEGAVAHSREEAAAELDKALKIKDVGIIVVTEHLVTQYPDLFDEAKKRRLPLVVEIPDRHGTEREKDFLFKYVHDAIGLKFG